MFRQEFKYLISDTNVEMLRELITPYLIHDNHIAVADSQDYTVRSIYFDTYFLDEYNKKLSGDYSREKIRIRGYIPKIDDDILFLEIKSKTNMSHKKYRSPISAKFLEHVYNSNITDYVIRRNDFPNSISNAEYFWYYIKRYNMVPVVQVIYEREAYIYKFDHTARVTIDKNLRCIPYPQINEFYSNQRINYVFRNHTILEVKSNYGFPTWMTPIINKLDLHREALSKYTLSIDTCMNSTLDYNFNEIISKSIFQPN